MDENPANVSIVMLQYSLGQRKHVMGTHSAYSQIHSALSFHYFKLVPENCVSYILQPAEKPTPPSLVQSDQFGTMPAQTKLQLTVLHLTFG